MENLIMLRDGCIKIIDFAFSTLDSARRNSKFGTKQLIAAEIMNTKLYDPKKSEFLRWRNIKVLIKRKCL